MLLLNILISLGLKIDHVHVKNVSRERQKQKKGQNKLTAKMFKMPLWQTVWTKISLLWVHAACFYT